MFDGLDHVAIVVRDTDDALSFYRDTLGFPVVVSEVVNDPPVRLTHLDMGNAHLQLVEPVSPDHPLHAWLDQHGEGLHHICFKVGDVKTTLAALPEHGLAPLSTTPHAGPRGRAAAFIEPARARGLRLEITSDPKPASSE